MARDPDWKRSWREKRERDEEREKDWNQKKGSVGATNAEIIQSQDTSSDHVRELLSRGESMIEQLNTLYIQYFSGAEKRPPVERRKQLNELMAALRSIPKPGATLQFRFQTLQNRFLTYTERWDKQLSARDG